jgi:hypothetical protein
MSKVKVSDILSQSIETYRLNRKLSWKQEKVLGKIINCSTDEMELQHIACTKEECDYSETRRKPCGDRHCNRCNQNKKLKWMKKMMTDFLSVPYHHVVFTLPEELRNLAICNQVLLYDIFFNSSFNVLNKFGADRKYFGGKIGFIGLLHTWGQTLTYHPHIHFMVMSGGIKDGAFKQLPYSKKFLFPVKAMSKVMMGEFIEKLKCHYQKGELKFPGKLEEIASDQKFNNFLYKLSKKQWVIFNKAPFNGSSRVLEYLSRYTHKVAIANYRIKEHNNGSVVFEYKDYKKKNADGVSQKKLMSLCEVEFTRRFLLHVLPNGFRKLRYGGIFSSNQKKFAIATLKQFYKSNLDELNVQFNNWYNEVKKYIEVLCPVCGDKLNIVTIYHNSS